MLRKIGSGWGTLRLLYQIDRSAFLIGTFTSVVQSLVLPLILLVLWQGFSVITAGGGPDDLVHRAALLVGGLFVLLALQTVLQIVNETAASVLQAESAQHVNARIIGKMSEVPYSLFEDNDFQARYGLLISQASYRPGVLVQAFVGSVGALGSSLAIAVTLLALAPLLDLFLLVLIPLTLVESRYRTRVLELQTHSAPGLFRMMYLTQRSIDATWQRDIRVHGSTILNDEYHVLAETYLVNMKRLLQRYQLIRVGVGIGAAAVMTVAMAAVFWYIHQSPTGLAQAAILLPALVIGLGQGRSFAQTCGTLTECLAYLAQVFEFLDASFDQPADVTSQPVSLEAAVPLAA